MDSDVPDEVPEQQPDLFDRIRRTRHEVARTADLTARVMEHGAEVHAALAGSVPDALERAERNRRLAAAERLSADALRRGGLPPEEVRQVVRDGGRTPDQDEAGPGA